MAYYILLGIFLVAIAVIAVIIIKKFPRLVVIDVSTILSDQQAKVKEELIWQRVARKFKEKGTPLWLITKELKQGIGGLLGNVQKKAKDLEKKYTLESKVAKPAKIKPGSENKLKDIVDEGNRLFSSGKISEAEEKFIAAISLDKHYAEAYLGLARVYFEGKRYDQAKETLDFIVKLGKAGEKAYDLLGEIAYIEGRYNEAKEYYLIALGINSANIGYHLALAKTYIAMDDREAAQSSLVQAHEIEPKNPKTLDLLIENSIILGKKDEAKEAWKEFKQINPDNPKLSEWEDKIKKL